jgi:hypothetical protein
MPQTELMKRLSWLLIQGYEVRITRDAGQSQPFSRGAEPVEHVPVVHTVEIFEADPSGNWKFVRKGKGATLKEALVAVYKQNPWNERGQS